MNLRRRTRCRGLRLEPLEGRLLFSGDDSFATAQALTCGRADSCAARSNVILAVDDVDLYYADLRAGQRVQIEVAAAWMGSSLDGLLRVFDADGHQIAVNDDAGGSVDPALTVIIPATGRYYIGVSSSGNDAYEPVTPAGGSGLTTGAYGLTVLVDTNETIDTATPVAFQPAAIHCLEGDLGSGNVNMFAIDLVAGRRVRMLVKGAPGMLRLFDAAGTQLATATAEADEDDYYYYSMMLDYTVVETGTYYLGLSFFGNDSYDPHVSQRTPDVFSLPYTLTVWAVDSAAADAGDDTLAGASPLDLPSDTPATLSGNVRTPSDVDLYAVEMAAGQRLIWYTEWGGGFVPLTRVFDATGTQVAVAANASPESPLEFIAAAAGTYYIGMSSPDNTDYDPHVADSGWGTSTGSFYIYAIIDGNNTPADATTVNVPLGSVVTVSGDVQPPDGAPLSYSDADVYAVTLGAGELLTIATHTTALESHAWLYIELLDSSGNNVATTDSSGGGSEPAVHAVVSQAGTYYVRVTAWLYGGPYELDLGRFVGAGDDTPGGATPVSLVHDEEMQLSGSIDTPLDVDFYAVQLLAGQHLDVSAQAAEGGELGAYLRMLDSEGNEVAHSNADSANAAIVYTVVADSLYYVGVSSSANVSYDPTAANSGVQGPMGDYVVGFLLEGPQPDMVGTSCQITEPQAAWGDTVHVVYTLTNAGNNSAGPFDVVVRLSADSTTSGADQELTRVHVSGLAAGASTTLTIAVALPGSAAQAPAGFSAPAEVFLGAVIDPDGAIPESDRANNSNQGRGRDAARLLVLGPETEPNNTPAQAQAIVPSTRLDGAIDSAADVDCYRVTLTEAGRLTIRVTADDPQSLDPLARLYGPGGQLLGTSDDASSQDRGPWLVQYLAPGEYVIAVSASSAPQATPAAYRLATDFQPASLLSFTGDATTT